MLHVPSHQAHADQNPSERPPTKGNKDNGWWGSRAPHEAGAGNADSVTAVRVSGAPPPQEESAGLGRGSEKDTATWHHAARPALWKVGGAGGVFSRFQFHVLRDAPRTVT